MTEVLYLNFEVNKANNKKILLLSIKYKKWI